RPPDTKTVSRAIGRMRGRRSIAPRALASPVTRRSKENRLASIGPGTKAASASATRSRERPRTSPDFRFKADDGAARAEIIALAIVDQADGKRRAFAVADAAGLAPVIRSVDEGFEPRVGEGRRVIVTAGARSRGRWSNGAGAGNGHAPDVDDRRLRIGRERQQVAVVHVADRAVREVVREDDVGPLVRRV